METITADHPTTTTETEIDIKIVTTKQKRCQFVKICVIAALTILSLTFLLFDVVITVKSGKRLQESKKSIKFLQDKKNEAALDLDLLSLLENKTKLKQFCSLGEKETGTSQSLDDGNFLAAYVMIVQSRKECETEKLLGVCLDFGENVTSQNIFLRRFLGEKFLKTARRFSPTVNNSYLSFIREVRNSSWLNKLEAKRQQFSFSPLNISSTCTSGNSSVCASEWLNLTSKYCHLLFRLESEEAQRILFTVNESIKKNTLLLILRSVLACVVLIILPFLIMSLVKVQNEFYKHARSLHHKVVLEKSRTEFLLSENSRHMAGMAERWKEFCQQSTNAENPNNQTQRRGSIKECWANQH